jgi:tetrahydromethanopterin S-methyltransferase subunit G
MLTQEDLKNIENLLQPKFDQINQRLDKLERKVDR